MPPTCSMLIAAWLLSCSACSGAALSTLDPLIHLLHVEADNCLGRLFLQEVVQSCSLGVIGPWRHAMSSVLQVACKCIISKNSKCDKYLTHLENVLLQVADPGHAEGADVQAAVHF